MPEEIIVADILNHWKWNWKNIRAKANVGLQLELPDLIPCGSCVVNVEAAVYTASSVFFRFKSGLGLKGKMFRCGSCTV